MKVSAYMTQKVITARPEEGVRQVFFRMRAAHIRHMPVVKSKNRLVGIISDRDLRRPDWAEESLDISHVYRLDDSLEVSDLMNTTVYTVFAYETINRALEMLLELQVGALPVLSKAGRLIGILTAVDLLEAFRAHLESCKR